MQTSPTRDEHVKVKTEPIDIPEELSDLEELTNDESEGNPPIRFTINDIKRRLGDESLAVSIRRFYSDNEWARFSEQDRIIVFTKVLEYRKKNRSGNDMSKPNTFASTRKMDSGQLEVWPETAKDREFSLDEKDIYKAAIQLGTQDKVAQRQCASRFNRGKVKFYESRQSCCRCFDLHYGCICRAGLLTCEACSEQTPPDRFRCEYLERFYVDYASRELMIDLSTSLALFNLVGAPGRTYLAKGRALVAKNKLMRKSAKSKTGISSGSVSRNPAAQPAGPSGSLSKKTPTRTSSRPKHNEGRPKGMTLRSQPNAKRPSGVRNESPSPFSLSPSPSPSVVEISRLPSPAAEESASGGSSRPAKRRRLTTNGDHSSVAAVPAPTQSVDSDGTLTEVNQVEPTPNTDTAKNELGLVKQANKLLRQQYEALRALSQTYYHQVDNVHMDLGFTIHSLVSASREAPDIVRPLVLQRGKLQTASSEYREKLVVIDEKVHDDTLSL